MFLHKKMKYALSFVAILFAALAVSFFFNSNPDRTAEVQQAQADPSNTAKALLEAMVTNDEYMLRAIVVPQQQDEVTKWLDTHKPFQCGRIKSLLFSFPDLADDNFNKRIAIVDKQFPQEDRNTVHINAIYSCLLDKSSYGGLNFQIYKIVIEKRGNRWFVTSWGKPCEVKSVAGCM